MARTIKRSTWVMTFSTQDGQEVTESYTSEVKALRRLIELTGVAHKLQRVELK